MTKPKQNLEVSPMVKFIVLINRNAKHNTRALQSRAALIIIGRCSHLFLVWTMRENMFVVKTTHVIRTVREASAEECIGWQDNHKNRTVLWSSIEHGFSTYITQTHE